MLWLSGILEGIRSFIELGGWVVWVIMAVLFFMWTLIIERLWYFYKVFPSEKKQIVRAWDNREDTTSWYAKRIREQMISDASLNLKRFVPFIKALIAICPLVGLMGTVVGMIAVFDVMTIHGTSNAREMAGGVSKATVPTMAGMVAALSGVYFGTWFEHKASTEAEKLEDLMQHH